MGISVTLTPIDPDDDATLAQVWAIQSDPATWKHLPQARPDGSTARQAWATQHATSWRDVGLGWWVVRLGEPLGGLSSGSVIGTGGCGATMPGVPAWNLGYRLTPAVWGHGLAGQIARQALESAHRVRPEWPVTARVLTRNPASWHVLERAGLTLAWEGAIAADDPLTAGLVRRVYADRRLDDDLLRQLIALG